MNNQFIHPKSWHRIGYTVSRKKDLIPPPTGTPPQSHAVPYHCHKSGALLPPAPHAPGKRRKREEKESAPRNRQRECTFPQVDLDPPRRPPSPLDSLPSSAASEIASPTHRRNSTLLPKEHLYSRVPGVLLLAGLRNAFPASQLTKS